MKTIIFASIMVLSSLGMAATCPSGSQLVKSCKSTPKTGDEDVAASTFDSIAICSLGSQPLIAVEKGGQQDVTKATAQIRMGGTTYSVTAGDVDFSLSVVTGILSKKAPARFTINYKQVNLKASSTYTCQ